MTGPVILPAIAAGLAAESIRLMPRLCACPWTGPFPGARPITWQRTGTDEQCAIHGWEARERRANPRGGVR